MQVSCKKILTNFMTISHLQNKTFPQSIPYRHSLPASDRTQCASIITASG